MRKKRDRIGGPDVSCGGEANCGIYTVFSFLGFEAAVSCGLVSFYTISLLLPYLVDEPYCEHLDISKLSIRVEHYHNYLLQLVFTQVFFRSLRPVCFLETNFVSPSVDLKAYSLFKAKTHSHLDYRHHDMSPPCLPQSNSFSPS